MSHVTLAQGEPPLPPSGASLVVVPAAPALEGLPACAPLSPLVELLHAKKRSAPQREQTQTACLSGEHQWHGFLVPAPVRIIAIQSHHRAAFPRAVGFDRHQGSAANTSLYNLATTCTPAAVK